jgi:hypothetical protein
MSTFNACPYADSRRFPATDGGLRTALTRREVLRAENDIDAITSPSALRYYISKNVAFIGEPDGSAPSRLYNTTLEAWRALDDSVWDLAKSQDKMREAMQALQDEMNATSGIMLRLEKEKEGLDKMMERHMPEIRETIRGDQRKMRREDEAYLRRRKEERGDYGGIQKPWRESNKEKKRRLERASRNSDRWGSVRGTGWGSWKNEEKEENDGWSQDANWNGEGNDEKAEPTEEEWKQWGGKSNADAEWWNGHYDEE